MGKGKDLSPRKKGQIRVLLENSSLKQKEIAKKLDISVQTVSKIKKTLDSGGLLDSSRIGKCGRKKKTTPRIDRKIKLMALNDRRTSCKRIAMNLAEDGIQVSPRTVNNRLLDAGLKAYRPRKKPLLTKKMLVARLQWAKEHEAWTTEDWDKVIKIE